MPKPNAKHWPSLKEAWDDYGHCVEWNDLVDMKVNRDCYAVLLFKAGDDFYEVADLARGGRNAPWEMQNDGSAPISMKQWKGLHISEDCDSYVIPAEENL